MSVSLWNYDESKCEGKECMGDCDFCPLANEDGKEQNDD